MTLKSSICFAMFCSCPIGWEEKDNSCFLFKKARKTWKNANDRCQIEQHGAHLMYLEGRTKTFLKQLMLESLEPKFRIDGSHCLMIGSWVVMYKHCQSWLGGQSISLTHFKMEMMDIILHLMDGMIILKLCSSVRFLVLLVSRRSTFVASCKWLLPHSHLKHVYYVFLKIL